MFKSVFKSGIRAAYDVSSNPTFVSEPWYVYPAKHYSSGRVVSVFIFDKTKFEAAVNKLCQNMSNTKNPRVIVSECYELLKFEVGQMAKLKHPQLLTVYETLEETKTKFLFVTEAVSNNLTTVNVDSLDELAIQKGLLEVCKSVQFLHNVCAIIHLNIQPSSVFINQQGDWKLAGFRFMKSLNEISPSERENYYIMNNSSVVPFANYNVNFTPPELMIDSHSQLDFGNDVWSLACLIFYVYNGEHIIDCFDSSSVSDFRTAFKKFEAKFYHHRVSDLKYVLKKTPDKLQALYPRLMARVVTERMSIDQFIDSDFFNGSLIKAMWFIDEFSTKSLDDKLVFLKGLLDSSADKSLLDQLPSQYKTAKLLPMMIELLQTELNVALNPNDVGSDHRIEYVCLVLSIVFKIGNTVSSLTFQDRIHDALLTKGKSRRKNKDQYFDKLVNFSVKVRLTLVEHLEILEVKLKADQLTDIIKNSVDLMLTLPSTEMAYKQEQAKLQDLFFSKTKLFASKLEFPYIKNTFFPLICQVFKTTTILSTKVATISVFELFIEDQIIDKLIVNEQLLPIFQNLKSRDKRIVDAALNFFVKLCKSSHIQLDLEIVVESILPICLKLVYGCNECTQSEFKSYMKSVNELQNDLTQKKLASLPTAVPKKATAAESNTFETLVNSQNFNDGNLESIQAAPHAKIIEPKKTESVLQPKRATSSFNSTNFGQTGPLQPKSKPAPKPAFVPAPRQTPSFSPNLTPTQPINNLSNYNVISPNRNTINLTSTPAPSNTTQNLLNKLDDSWDKHNEFSDFQAAPAQTSWNVSGSAVPQTPTLPILSPTMNSPKSPPPGFSGSILTPTSKSSTNNNKYNII